MKRNKHLLFEAGTKYFAFPRKIGRKILIFPRKIGRKILIFPRKIGRNILELAIDSVIL